MLRACPSVRLYVCVFVCLFVCRQIAKNAIFSKTKSLELWSLLTTYRKSYTGFSKNPLFIGPLKSNMAEIHHLESRHDVIFFFRGWSDLDKILQTGAEWHVDCGDMVEIETRCIISIWRTFWRIQWHVIAEPPAALQGVRIPSAWLKIVFAIFYFILFFNAVWALTSGGFRIVCDTVV